MWGKKRIAEIPVDVKLSLMPVENKTIEIGKVEDRLKKFTDKMIYLDTCKTKLADAVEAKKKIKKSGIGVMEIR